MKKLITLLCVVVLLIAATGAVSAGKPEEDSFTITGYTTFADYPDGTPLPNGHVRYHLQARGGEEGYNENAFCQLAYGFQCQALCQDSKSKACGVAGSVDEESFTGWFTFDEWVDFDPNSGKIKNNAVLTIVTPDGSAVVKFDGQTDSVNVWGKFKVEKKEGTGAFDHFKGHGDYTGDADYVFTVTFTGKLKD